VVPAPDPDFSLDVREHDGRITVAPSGELDISTVPQVERALRPEDHEVEAVTLDLSGLSFMDTSGLRLVLEEDRRARTGGHTLQLVPGAPHVQRVFELAGILDRLPFVPSSG
jgi:anti-sigma B factor antagonist